MSKDHKPQDGNSRAKDLLDELDSIQSLLGDAARDVPQSDLDSGDIPVLPLDQADEPASGAEGDAHNQIPLLGGEEPSSGVDPLRKALAERDNPFLPRAPASASKPAQPSTRAIEEQIARRAESPQRSPAPSPSRTLAEPEVRQLVDEILARWMPRIERELRDRLMEELRDTPPSE